jgi:predicted nucleic acid-binding protein
LRAILDTSVLLAGGVGELEGELAVSAASLAELHFGVLVAKDEGVRAERLRRLGLIESTFDPIPIDAAVARSYGHLAAAAAAAAAGRRPRAHVMDLLIAATAHAHHARLYTRNPKDLRGLQDVIDIAAIS